MIVRTYRDEGISGLRIEKRQGLQGEELGRIKLRMDALNVEQHPAPPSSE